MPRTLDNEKGQSAAFTTVTPFRGLRGLLSEVLVLVRTRVRHEAEEPMADRRFLHHALWVCMPARSLRPPRQLRRRGAPLPGRALLFTSYFTGDVLDYLRGFTDILPTAMDALWGPCREWPEKGASDYGATKRFVLAHRFRTDAYFSSRGDLGVDDARMALATRDALDALAALAPGASDAEFLAAYDEAVRAATNARPPRPRGCG